MDGINVNFRDGVVDGGYMWVFDNVLQAVCRIDLNSITMDIVQKYEGEKDISVGWIKMWNDVLYMVPLDSFGILIYDKNKKRFYERFDVPEIGRAKVEVSDVFIFENKLWIIPISYDKAVWYYELKKGIYRLDDKLTGIIKRNKSATKIYSPIFHRENNHLWIVNLQTNVYGKYDLRSETYDAYELEDKGAKLCGMCCVNEQKWFSFFDSQDIMCCDINEGCNIWNGDKDIRFPFSNIIRFMQYVLYLPYYADSIVVINIQTKELHTIEVESETVKLFYGEKMRNACADGERLFLLPYHGNKLFLLNAKTGEVIHKPLKSEFDYELERVRGLIAKNAMVYEDRNTTLGGFITYCRGVND